MHIIKSILFRSFHRNVFGRTGCEIWGVLASVSYIASTTTFALISLSRYILIAHAQQFKRIFPKRKCVLYCVITWILGVLLSLGSVTGWTVILYNPKTKACSYSRTLDRSYHYFVISVAFYTPLIVGTVSYILLLITVRRSRDRTKAVAMFAQINDNGDIQTQSTVQKNKSEPIRKSDVKLTRMLVVTFLVYVVCLGPYALLNFIDKGSRLPELVHLTASMFLFSNVTINPFIYGLMNKNFRNAYVSMFKKSNGNTVRPLNMTRSDL